MPRSRYLSFLNAKWPRVQAPRRRPESRRLQLEPLEDRRLLAVLTIAQENLLAGTPASQWDIDGSGDDNIQGYAAQMSVNHGERIDFKVDTDADDYRLDIYRIGYYGGMGARKVATIQPSVALPQNQPDPNVDIETGLVDAGNWKVSASWNVPADATSGVYIAKLVREDGTEGESHIIFVVRDDEGHSDLLFQTSDTTWQAYNDYGGANLYESSFASYGRATEVSYNRPFNTRGVMPINFFFGAEYAMVRFIESNGYNVSYTSGVDTSIRGDEILEHKAFLSVGHDEYWSGDQRANVEAARDAGVNLAFFSGNEVFWKTRWDVSTDSSHTPNRTLVTYKETLANAKIDPLPDVWTGTWRDPRFASSTDGGYPENALTGTIFSVNGDGSLGGSINVSAADAVLRFWRNTAVANLTGSQSLSLGEYVLGYEWDEDIDNGYRPAGLIRMSTSTYNVSAYIQDYGSTYAPGTATHHLVMYRAASGALVFGAGTVQWTWGLDGNHDVIDTTADVRMQQATVNLFADMGVQAGTLRAGLVQTTQSTDATRPVSTITSPAAGVTLTANIAYTVQGTAQDSGGGMVAAVEVSVDGGATWHMATGRNNWTYAFTPRTSGQLTIRSRAVDDSANLEVAKPGVIVNPTINPGVYSLWNAGTGPGTADSGDYQAAELGVKFRSDSDGFITGLRFYKSSANTGTHTASLWTVNGQLLATATFTNETASGWQQVNFATPVAVQAGVVYVASYHTNSGGYSTDRSYFASVGVDNGPLHAVANGVSGSNGVYSYGNSAFPTQSFSASNYWVDVVLNTAIAADTTPPTVDQFGVAGGGTTIETNSVLTVRFSEPIDPSSITSSSVMLVNPDSSSNASGCCSTPGGWCSGCPLFNAVNTPVVPATVVYDPVRQLATITPSSPLGTSRIYTVVVKGGATGVKDVAGNPLANEAWSSFLTKAQAAVPSQSLWSNSATPTTADSGDTQSIEVGVKFVANTSGMITGLKFYKSAANTGTHVGSLWSSTGQLLATATFTSETASGWQQVNFATPLAVTAGVTYVASYHATSGHYSRNLNFFGSQFTNGALSAPVGAGVYGYGASSLFPNQAYQNSNYWVDVLFGAAPPTDTTAPTVVSYNPTTGASDISTTAPVSITFSEALDSSTLTTDNLKLIDGGNNTSPATLTYNAATRTATLTPTAPLANLTNYTIFVRGGIAGVKDAAGNPMAQSASSSFVTVSAPVQDTTAPVPTATSPTTDATNVPTNVVASVTFSEPINAATVLGSDNAVLLKNATTRVTATVAYNAATNTVTITPSAPLENGASYTIFLVGGVTGIKDLAGNAMASNFVSAFTTATVAPPPPQDMTPPTVTSVTPAANATGVATSSAMSIVFSEAMTASTISSSTLVLRTSAGASVAATVSYNANTRTATVTPNSSLAAGTSYTLTIVGGSSGVKDLAGNALVSNVTSSFATASASATPVSLWPNSTTPGSADSGDGSSIELGVRFQANADGFITGLKFYKSAANTGTHTGSLWNANGQLLATGTFTGETASGWQTLTFATPVAITAGTTYVTSYHTNTGHYSVNRSSFASAFTSGPLTVLANGGVFAYGAGGMPSQSYQSSNYWVDPLFVVGTPPPPPVDTTPPTVTSVTPANSATGVATSATMSVVFSEAMTASTISGSTLVLRTTAGASVAATVSYNAATRTATVTPTSALASNTSYTLTIAGGAAGVKDSAGNALVADVVSSFTTVSAPPVDTTPPTVTSVTPAANATGVATSAAMSIVFSEAMTASTISGSTLLLRTAAGASVASTVSYNANTQTATVTPNSALAAGTSYTLTIVGGSSGVKDLAGNALVSDVTSSFATASASATPVSLWPNSTTPGSADSGDGSSIELGVRFQANADGFITGLKFYKSAANTGTHTGSLWNANGQLLATGTVTGETASGWQTLTFATPVAITAGTTYVTSYHTNTGHYAVTRNSFASAFTSGPLTVLANGGVFAYGAGGFPSSSYQASNYWVDPLFVVGTPPPPPVDTTAPTVTSVTPANKATGVATSATMSVVFSEAMTASTISGSTLVLRTTAGASVTATVSYNAATRTATVTPTSALASNTSYTLRIVGGAAGVKDAAGNALVADATSVFTTLNTSAAPVSLWTTATTPASADSGDASSVELGVKFQANANGFITGLRFYKSAANTGTHTGSLWSSTGQLLATGTFTNETASGWQTLTFATPVAITAGTTYVTSYHTNSGHYAVNRSYFASAFTSGPLTVLANGGVFLYGTGNMPTQSYQSSNYWVDPLFVAAG